MSLTEDIFSNVLSFCDNKTAYNLSLVSKELNFIFDKYFDPSKIPNVFRKAVINGYIEATKKLLKDKRVMITEDDSISILLACNNHDIPMMKILLNDSRIDPTIYNSHVFSIACENKNIELIKILAFDKRIRPKPTDIIPLINVYKN